MAIAGVPRRTEGNVSGTPAIHLSDVVCRFGSTVALDDVALDVGEGEIHALLGPNGAGKTTLLRVVAGLIKPRSGSVAVLGRTPTLTDRALRTQIGLAPAGNRTLYVRLSAMENLIFFGRIYGMRHRDAVTRARELIEAVGLSHAVNKRINQYSQGMQKRLVVARMLMARPRVLIVDEATHDLDPEGARTVYSLIRAETAQGASVVWATQRLDEIRGFASRVTVLNKGRTAFQGTVPDLLASGTTQHFLVRCQAVSSDPLTALRDAVGPDGVIAPTADSEHFALRLREGVPLGDVLVRIVGSGVQILACREEESLVETAMMNVTGTSADKP